MSETAATAKQDKPLHTRFARFVAELGKVEDLPLDERGAALLLAHMCTELGRDKVLAMKPGQATDYLKTFRARYPLACQALEVCDVVRFVYRLDMYEVEHDDENELRRVMSADILPPPAKVDVILVDAMAGNPAPARP